MKRLFFLCLALGGAAVFFLSSAFGAVDSFERKRRTLLDKPRLILWDDDGCDMTFYPYRKYDLIKEPASIRNFESVFLAATERTKTDVICYSTVFGFGYFSSLRAGIVNTNPMDEHGEWRNAVREFEAKYKKDALDLATDFARRNGKEIFLSLRFNDDHDASSTWEKPNRCFSPFKKENPDCLFSADPAKKPPHCGWCGVDFGKEKVRAFCRKYVREYCENYDLDGILFDFFRHPQLFTRVAWGGKATQEELDLMSGFMRELRRITDEVGRKRGRPFVVGARLPDSLDYARAVGIDTERWLADRSLDFITSGGYFQLEPWPNAVATAHRHGVRFYASLDDNRIGEREPALPGRASEACYRARAAVAMMQGADGVYYFNLEYLDHELQRRILSADPHGGPGVPKLYFSAFTGGLWTMHYFLEGGQSYRRLRELHPQKPVTLKGGESTAFSITLAEDWEAWRAKGLKPVVRARVLTDAKEPGTLRSLDINGRTFSKSSFKEGTYAFDIPHAVLVRGENACSVAVAKDAKVMDFGISVQ